MQRVVIQLISITQLHDTSQIHNGDPVTYMLDNTQVMGDKHICQVILLLQPVKTGSEPEPEWIRPVRKPARHR